MQVFKAGKKGKPKRRVTDQATDDTRIPNKIEVKAKGAILNVVPSHVWRQKSFKWDPLAFATEAEQLNARVIEPSKQDRSLLAFMDDPQSPMIYGISGNPDDSKAKYFAAYLIDLHMQHLGANANPIWATLYGGFDNPYLTSDGARPTLLVLSNLTPNSTTTKLEKARDLIEAYPDVPRLIVTAGMDPMSFLATRLYVPIHGLVYFSEKLVKARMEII